MKESAMKTRLHDTSKRWIYLLLMITLVGGMVPPAAVAAPPVHESTGDSRAQAESAQPSRAMSQARVAASDVDTADHVLYLPLIAHTSDGNMPLVEGVVTPGVGGVLTADDGRVRATFAPRSVQQETRVQYQELPRPTITTPDLAVGGPAFSITARDAADDTPVTEFPHEVQIIPATADLPATSIVTPSITITVRYTDADVWGLDLRTLALYTRSTPDDPWQRVPTAVYPDQHLLVAEIDHLSEFVPMARMALTQEEDADTRLVLDPDDNVGQVTWPGVGTVEEITYNVRLATAIKERFETDACRVDILLTRDSTAQPFVPRSTRSQAAINFDGNIFVTLAFNTLNGSPWGVEGDGGVRGWTRDDAALVTEFFNRIKEFTGRPATLPVQYSVNGTRPLYTEFATTLPVSMTYSHIETLFLDHNYDWVVINDDADGFPAIADAGYAALRSRLEAMGMTCGDDPNNPPPYPTPPSAEQLQRWRDLGFQNYQRYGADPVSFSTGNHILQVELFRIPGRGGLDLDFTLTYNAQDGRNDLFGYNWTFPYNVRTQRYSDDSVSVVLHDGRTYHYTWNGSGYDAPAGVYDQLEQTTTGWRWITPDETVLTFQEVYGPQGAGLGILTEWRDRQGNALHFEHDLSAQGNWQAGDSVPRPPLTAVRDDAGRTIAVTSDAEGRITRLTLPDGREFDFVYTDGNLTAMTNADTPVRGTRRYQYDERHRITHQWDPEDIFFLRNFYDDRDRVIEQIDASGVHSYLSYDPINRVTTFTDNGGEVWRYSYDDRNRVTAEEDPRNQTLHTTYDPDYNVTQATDARGNETHYTYDDQGNLTTRRDPMPSEGCRVDGYTSDITRWTYDEHNQVTQMTDALGHTWRYTYDSQGNLTRSEAPDGAVTRASYNAWGQPTSITDAENRTTAYAYDDYGNLITTTDAAGNVTTSTYDIVGREVTYTDANGHTVTFTYDGSDSITRITDPKTNESSFTYDLNDLLVRSTDRRGTTRDYQYDENLKLIAERDHADGHWTRYGYDERYRRTVMTDTLGFETFYDYDAIGQVQVITDTLGHPTRYSYDENGNLTAITDAMGARTVMTYDALDRLATLTDAAGNRTHYCYDAEDRLVRTIGPRDGEIYRYTYDEHDRLLTVTDPQGNVRRMEYDAVGNRIATIDPLDQRTDYRYDDLDRQIAVMRSVLSNGERPTTQSGYDPVGNTTVITSPRGFITTFDYDENDNVVTITDSLNGQTRYTYDEEDNPLTVTNANGYTTRTTYGPVGNPLTITDGLGQTTRMEYDPAYNLVKLINAEDRATVYEYDRMQRLIRTTDPLGNATLYRRDALGRVTTERDANGHTTGYSYDILGRLVAVTDALGHPTHYAYDEAGNLISITDANNNRTTFTYSLLNQLLAETNPIGETWRYAYDPNGRLARRIDALNRPTSYEYDSNDRLVGIQYGTPGPVQPPIRFAYDLDGNQTQMCDGLGCHTTDYDALGRPTSTTDWLDRTVRRTYDGVGNTVGMIYPNDWRVQYAYDANNQMVGLTDPRGATSIYKYNRLGQVTNIKHPNETSATLTYDAASRLTGIDHRRVGATRPQSAYSYALDQVGNRVAVTETRAAFDNSDVLATLEHTYDYDALNRLVNASTRLAVDGRSPPAGGERETIYRFDAVGNRLEQSGTVLAPDPSVPELPVAPRPEQTTYRYNEANQLLAAEGTAFRYNANGVRTSQSRTLPSGATETTRYSYDREDRLIQVTTSVNGVATMEATYDYDGYGRRARKTVSYPSNSSADHVITYLYDGLEIIGAQIKQGDTTSESYYYLAPSPVTGLRRPVAMQDLATGERHWYQSDGLDSIIALTDDRGDQVAPALYGDYGQMLAGDTALQIFTYTAQDYDPETGLIHFYARYYDPAHGVWLTQDSYRGQIDVPGTLHRYGYVNSNPITRNDKYGYFWDYVVDVGFIAYDIYTLVKEPSWENAGWLALDVGLAILPFVPAAAGATARGVKNTDRIVSGGNKGLDIIRASDDAIKGVDKVNDTLKAGDKVNDTLKAGDKAGDTSKGAQEQIEREAKEQADQGNGRYNRIDPPTNRKGLRKSMGEPPSGFKEPQAHHELPWKNRDFFAGKGINVNDPQFGRWVEGNAHRKWSAEYGREWDQFIEANPNATPQDIMNKLQELKNSGRFPSKTD
jgi:RHS repeat-associated protein